MIYLFTYVSADILQVVYTYVSAIIIIHSYSCQPKLNLNPNHIDAQANATNPGLQFYRQVDLSIYTSHGLTKNCSGCSGAQLGISSPFPFLFPFLFSHPSFTLFVLHFVVY